MEYVYAPVPNTASRSPLRTGGKRASQIRTSPDSQHRPATATVSVAASAARAAATASYCAPESAGRGVANMPPWTETEVRRRGIDLTPPPEYNVTPATPT